MKKMIRWDSNPTPVKSKKLTIIMIILMIVLIKAGVSLAQVQRYQVDKYDCTEMSRDCEIFFEKNLNIHTYMFIGEDENNDRHRWIVLDFGLFSIPYESTLLLVWQPMFRFNSEVKISEGVLVDGEIIDTPTFEDY